MSMLSLFLPTFEQLIGLMALVGILISFAIIGAAIAGTRRFSAADIFTGWGAVIFVFVLVGVFTRIDFKYLTYGYFTIAVMLSGFVFSRDRHQRASIASFNSLWRMIVLAIPFLLLVTAMRASQWDEFSQWLPNAQFLFQFGAFPNTNLPKIHSALPAYPYGLPLVTYFTSVLAGHFVENTSAIFNLLLLFFHAIILAHIINEAIDDEKNYVSRWSLIALCMLAVTILSTTFVQKIVLTSYADSTTAVTLAVITILIWKILNKLSIASPTSEVRADISTLSWQCGFIITVFLYLKQPNFVLLILLMAGFLIVVLRDPAIRLLEFLKLWPKLLLPGLIIYFAWRYHVSQHLSYGEFSLLPFESWLLSDAINILARMSSIAAKKAPFFIVMLTISYFAIRGFFKVIGPTERLLLPIAVVFLGFNFFLWLMYIAAFGAGEGLRAASFWRYNTQLGLLGVTGAAYGLAVLWRRYDITARIKKNNYAQLIISLPIIIVLILPVTLHHKLRFDVRPQKDHMRLAGQELAKILPKNSSIAVIDLKGNGFTGKVIRYELTSVATRKNINVPIDLRVQHGIKKSGQIKGYLEKHAVAYAWVHQPFPLIETALGVKLEPYASHLLKKTNGSWIRIKTWPYAGYKDPHSLPD